MARYRRTVAELAEPVACRDCGDLTHTPRRSRCTRCYTRLRRTGRLDEHEACSCGESDPAVLVGTRDGARCLNCRARAEFERLTA